MNDRCCSGPRTKAVWESDDHEPEGAIPIGGEKPAGEMPDRVRVTLDGLEHSKAGGPYEPLDPGQPATVTNDGGDLSCAIPGVHVQESGQGGAPIRMTPSAGKGSGQGGAPIRMTPSAGKDVGPVMIREVKLGFAHLGELAAQLNVQPLPKGGGGGAHLCMTSKDGLEYDLCEVLLKLLEKVRTLPNMVDTVSTLELTTDEGIRRQAKIDELDDKSERLVVQLAGCLMAAEGNAVGSHRAEEGDYGWSAAYEAVVSLQDGYQEARQELERRKVADAAVKVATENRLDLTRDVMRQGALVVLAALDSQSGGARLAAEKLLSEDAIWFVTVELQRLKRDHICPKCEKVGGDLDGSCCNEECGGDWDTGCYHCDSATFMDWELAYKLLLHRRAKQRG